MVARLSGVNICVLFRFVKRRVLDGGVGWERGGRWERSRVRLDLREAEEEERDGLGDGSIVAAVTGGNMGYGDFVS